LTFVRLPQSPIKRHLGFCRRLSSTNSHPHALSSLQIDALRLRREIGNPGTPGRRVDGLLRLALVRDPERFTSVIEEICKATLTTARFGLSSKKRGRGGSSGKPNDRAPKPRLGVAHTRPAFTHPNRWAFHRSVGRNFLDTPFHSSSLKYCGYVTVGN
jgi:hypothetical protein